MSARIWQIGKLGSFVFNLIERSNSAHTYNLISIKLPINLRETLSSAKNELSICYLKMRLLVSFQSDFLRGTIRAVLAFVWFFSSVCPETIT